MTPSVLVTGARGFLGRHVLRSLVGQFEIHAVTRDPREPKSGGVQWHACDLLDHEQRQQLMRRVRASYLVHLAWVTEHGQYWSSPQNMDWAAATLLLLREFTEGGGRRAVIAGSCAEYDWTEDGPYGEDSKMWPATLYGAAKLATGALASSYAQSQPSLSLSWARIFYLYGPGEHEDRLVPSLIRSSLRGEAPRPTEPGNVIDLMHVEDAGAAIAALLMSEVEGPANICTGNPITIRALATQIAEVVGIDRPQSDRIEESCSAVVGNPRRLIREVGYRGGRDLHTGLTAAVDHWKRHDNAIQNLMGDD